MKILRSAALIGSALSALSCADATGPAAHRRGRLVLHVGPEGPATIGRSEEGTQEIRCDVRLDMRSDEAPVRVRAGWIRFYVGEDRRVPVDSFPVDDESLRLLFGDDLIAETTPAAATLWRFRADVPFGVEFSFRYEPAPGEKPATADGGLGCGMPGADASSGHARIDSMRVTDARPRQHRDSIFVVIHGAAPAGLWKTRVVLDGTCVAERVLPGALGTEVATRVAVAVPLTCRPGSTVTTATVTLIDALLRETVARTSLSIAVIDTTPPVATSRLGTHQGPLWDARALASIVAGDILGLDVDASDNHAVAWIGWEAAPGGARDSVRPEPRPEGEWRPATSLSVATPASGSGILRVRGWARDHAGNLRTASTEAPDSVLLIGRLPHVTTLLPAVPRHGAAVYDAPRGRLYGVRAVEFNVSDRTYLEVVSPPDGRVTARREFAERITQIDVAAGGDTVILVMPTIGAIGVVDVAVGSYVPRLLRPIGLDSTRTWTPAGAQILANGRVLSTWLGGPADRSFGTALAVVEFDLATSAQRLIADPAAHTTPCAGDQHCGSRIVRSGDRRTAGIVTGAGLHFTLSLYDATTDAIVAQRPHHGFSAAPVLDATGSRVLVGDTLYDRSLQRLGVAPPQVGSVAFFAPPRGELLLRSATHELRQVDVVTGVLRGGVLLPMPPGWGSVIDTSGPYWPAADGSHMLVQLPSGHFVKVDFR